ncbi:MAG: transaldolase family protein [Gemmatimonadales bacterium]
MELYLDSADLTEIEEAFKLGFLDGLTTTPTFMHRHGVTDIDSLILRLADIVPVLQVEALGQTADEICTEAHRLLDLGLARDRTVFKIPVSLQGVKACHRLRTDGILVNVHLVYTLQQAFMAMKAGATYVCPLVGRLQDQGHDALTLVQQCVAAVDRYQSDTKVMFSSVRHVEHVRNAITLGVHTITVPYRVLTQLTENHFTTVGTDQFFEHTRLLTTTVGEVMSSVNPVVPEDTGLQEAIILMTEYGFGCVTVIDADGGLKGLFTDGDLRRLLEKEGRDILQHRMSDFSYQEPLSVGRGELLSVAAEQFHTHKVDNLLVTEQGKPVGMLDIQDL